ncbi:ABC transporter permease [Microbacterium sediminis]|uniref:ABC transporter permease n=1 Tax=Microbacterium sediminis TaxID=904291 RepID=A0A1B9NGH0_9MICO|nr:ABC transporter permease [Microbacterium sediminis]OCG75692.1 hypothetical protein A7J15_01170 [Microbacterium sediminis]
MSWLTSAVSSFAEAWQELRVHRMRIILSLFVVAISVAAFTAVVALGQMLNQGFQESMERGSGRPALVSFSAYNAESGENPSPDTMQRAFAATLERHAVDWSARVSWLDVAPPPDGWSDVRAVDADYGVIHRVPMLEGTWFSPLDEERLTPVAIVNESWWQSLGAPALTTAPTVSMALNSWDPNTGEPIPGATLDAVIIGVTPDQGGTGGVPTQTGYVLYKDALAVMPDTVGPSTQYEAWIPPETAEELMESMRLSFAANLGDGFQVDAYRMDYEAMMEGSFNPFDPMLIVLGGISMLVLALGALSLLNITLVTTRFRIREIGVRRSFGATGVRVFFSVMLESVVGTVFAGVAGIVIAILALRIPALQDSLFQGIQDVPPFPMRAAPTGLLVSAAVGALAGLLPALIAMRVKPIDAIRF